MNQLSIKLEQCSERYNTSKLASLFQQAEELILILDRASIILSKGYAKLQAIEIQVDEKDVEFWMVYIQLKEMCDKLGTRITCLCKVCTGRGQGWFTT